MKLHVAPGACSMSCHIAAEESKFPVEVVVAPWGDKAKFAEIERLNPAGAVPVLVLEDGTPLTQNVAILTFIAEKMPAAKLLAEPATIDRAFTMQWLAWAASDLHPAFHSLFDDEASEEDKKAARENVLELLGRADRQLEGRDFLVGKGLTVADCYLFTVLGWTKGVGIDIDKMKNLSAFAERIMKRPAVQAVMKREGEGEAETA